MIVTDEHLNLHRYETDKIQPASIVPRALQETWIVRNTPVESSTLPRYLVVSDGEHVHIPVFPYVINNHEPVNAMATSTKLGAMCIEEIGPLAEILRLHIVVGHPLQETPQGFRFWIGFGAVVKRREHV